MDQAKIKECEGLISITNKELEIEKSNLTALVSSGSYGPSSLGAEVHRFMMWFLSSGELSNPSAFHALQGQQIRAPSRGEFQYIIRVRQAAQESSGGLCTGCVVISDGSTIWSDLDDATTSSISDFISIQENKSLRESYSILMTLSAAGVDFTPPGRSESGSGPASPLEEKPAVLKRFVRTISVGFGIGKKNEMQPIERWQKQEETWSKYILSRRGFIR